MSAIFNKGILISDNVIVYPDSEDQNNFFYISMNLECILNKNLEEFKLTYWGYGKQFIVKQENGKIESVIGAIFTGTARPDISIQQRNQIVKQILKTFEVDNPKLTPLSLSNIKVQPFIGTHIWKVGKDSDILFPESMQLGTAFNFLIGTGNRLFTKYIGYQKRGTQIVAHPSIGINIVGEAEFTKEPWLGELEADLSKVWSYVRQRVSENISWEWLELKFADYQNLIQDMLRDKVIKLTVKQGTVNLQKPGWQILEIGRQIFAAVNNQGNSETGYFRFEPNSTAQISLKLEDRTFWLWKIAINLAYGSQSIPSSTSTHYKSTINYSERLIVPIPISLFLNVKCNIDTAQLFQDLGNVSETCITQQKIQDLQQRITPEISKQTQFVNRLYNRLIAKEISQQQYDQAMNLELTH